LQVREGLALPANEPPRFFGFHIQQQAIFQVLLLDGGLEAELMEHLFQGRFRLRRHTSVQVVWE
jgi:hypothetical protein